MVLKQKLMSFLRHAGLIETADGMKFIVDAVRHYPDNRRFLYRHKGLSFPPPYMLYESFGRMSYRSYYENGRESARYILELLENHVTLDNACICEWGCGPARLIRHVPALLNGRNARVYGTDFNDTTIEWCRNNIGDITFSVNGLAPPLPSPALSFDALFCISVFTHLSPELQQEWCAECMRVLKPGGVFLLTVHVDSCTSRLLPGERARYGKEGCVVRGNVTEGKRTFTTYNSPAYMKRTLLAGYRILEHIPGKSEGEQDIWIVCN